MRLNYYFILSSFFIILCVGCNLQEETIDTAYQEPLPPVPTYKFSRHGKSSVNTLYCKFLDIPLNALYKSYFRQARINNLDDYQKVNNYLFEGSDGIAPFQAVATSATMQKDSAIIKKELLNLIDQIAKLSGYYNSTPSPFAFRNRKATMGQSGFVGQHIGDNNIYFVDDLGVAKAEELKYYLQGAIYIDQMFNVHLQETLFQDTNLIAQHEQIVLEKGGNYTTLEHHLDLAYGFYSLLQPLSKAEGLSILKHSDHTLYTAFVQARIHLGDFQYQKVLEQIALIKAEFSKVIAVRILNLLIGANTLANLQDGPVYAFEFLSQAIGLIHCLPFMVQSDGSVAFTYAETKSLIDNLLQEQGLWNKNKLLADLNHKGSLYHTAQLIGKPFNLSFQSVQR